MIVEGNLVPTDEALMKAFDAGLNGSEAMQAAIAETYGISPSSVPQFEQSVRAFCSDRETGLEDLARNARA